MKSDALVVSIGLSVAIVSVEGERPSVLVVGEESLPFGPFDPAAHRTMEGGLRKWVGEQTGAELGYAEQLYTFGDRGRHLPPGADARVVSVGYLALARQSLAAADARWQDWYRYFPWEDWRVEKPAMIDKVILPALRAFVKAAPDAGTQRLRRDRMHLSFASGGLGWDEERVLERYELLYEAGLVAESRRDAGLKPDAKLAALGTPMGFDHRRILATAIARLRGKMKYRPVVFELMPPFFTLLELQRTVEAVSGIRLHKQNFRRLVGEQGLVEGTGRFADTARGRPAELFRFRPDVLLERPAPGLRVTAKR